MMALFGVRDIATFLEYFRLMNARYFLLILLAVIVPPRAAEPERLPNTVPLQTHGDLASNLVAQVDLFLLQELSASRGGDKGKFWNRDFTSAEAYDKSIETNRARLAHIIGARDRTNRFVPQRAEAFGDSMRIGSALDYTIYSSRAHAFGDVTVEAIVLWPEKPIASAIAIPDADVTPEQLCGISEGIPAQSQYARILAQSGFAVVVPTIINRQIQQRRNVKLSNREFLYRPAFEMGRHIIGYEVLKILSIVDRLEASPIPNNTISVVGWGEGGLLAMMAAALDTRIKNTVVSGYFGDRREMWKEPIDRNIFAFLREFGDAELASMIAPRALIIEASRWPDVTIVPRQGGGPGKLATPPLETIRSEFGRALSIISSFNEKPLLELVVSGENGDGPNISLATLRKLLDQIAPQARVVDQRRDIDVQRRPDAEARMESQIHELDRHTQWLLAESAYARDAFMKNLDFSSPEKYAETSAKYREYFYSDVIGRIREEPMSLPNPASRLRYDKTLWKGYDVSVWLGPNYGAHGIFLLPKDIKPGEQRPVVVCQHGLEGRPEDLIEGDKAAYHDYAARLADRGFIVFAPQNLYIFQDRFRTLQRKANPLGLTLFSIITLQHQQIIAWLKSLPYVDPKRIAFYGLSYGGKTAMRVPALLTDYCLSICSADFNDWIWKNASTRSPYSYVYTGEYEIFEFDLGNTFNYAEMAALIAPRPFMVERGHFDNVAPDETVAYEFAKVRRLYDARLKIPGKTEIEFFVGPHTINGKGTFDFLHNHLNWPKPQ